MRALYISYDGMTDQLGQSQVIPYLAGLRRRGHEFTILSCEKPDRFADSREKIRRLLDAHQIRWEPIVYHKKPPILSTVYDLARLHAAAAALHRRHRFELVHCRSYVASLVGLRMKRRHGLKFLFDMRGFWADERVDGGLWKLSNPAYLAVYRYFKAREREFLTEADAVVSLTHLARDEILRWSLPAGARERLRIEVIPCCADLEHFSPSRVSSAQLEALKRRLGLGERELVVLYLGSVGTWYMLGEMFAFFRKLVAARPEARLLFVTPDSADVVREAAVQAGVDPARLAITRASREEVPALIAAASLGLFFIKPVYSKMSSSPTKLGEILAMGVPVVMNSGVGDSDFIAEKFETGALVRDFNDAEYARVIAGLDRVLALPPAKIREAAQSYFSLEQGVARYAALYDELARR